MITILRKHHRWLMIVIAILAVPFVFYFNKTDLGASRANDIGHIYDRPVTQVEYTRNARLLNLAQSLGLSLGNDLMTANVRTQDDMYVEFTWNRLVLRHEAERLGIRPSSNEITDFVKTLTPFQGEKGFDLDKYTEFTTTTLPALGFNEAHIEEIVSDQLTLNRVKELLGTSVQPSEIENAENYQKAYGKMDVAVVRLRNEDLEKDVKITDEDIAKYFEAHKEQLKSEEKRRVEFVTFALTEAEKKLTGKERLGPLQKAADRANDFTQALLEKDANFGAVAEKLEVPLISTGEFTVASPDPKMAANPELTQNSFRLTQQSPFSDPVQGQDGFSVLHLLAVTEARPLSLEEAKPKIVEAVKSERLRELISKRGSTLAQQMRDGLKAGTPLEIVAEQDGLKLERIPPFAFVEAPPKSEADKTKKTDKNTLKLEPVKIEPIKLETANVQLAKEITAKEATPAAAKLEEATPDDAKSKNKKSKNKKAPDEKPAEVKPAEVKAADVKPKNETPDFPAIKNAVSALNPGEVTDFVPLEKGGLVAVLEKRAPADPAGYAEAKEQYETQFLSQRKRGVFMEWLRDRRRVSGAALRSS